MNDDLFRLFGMLWTAHQDYGSTVETNVRAGDTSIAAHEAREQVEFIRMDIERLLMVTEALWILLRDEHGYSDEQLIKQVQTIDLRDGRLDGRVARQAPTTCPQCGRTVAARHSKCMYCGSILKAAPFGR